MKIAVPYENGQVFQNFCHSAQFKIEDTENGKLLSSEIVSTNAANATFRNQIGIWKLMLFHMQRAGHFCERPVQWSRTKPALQILHGPRSSASHRSFSTCPAVHPLILPARRRLPETSSYPPELLRRRLLQFLFAEQHRTLLFLFQDGSSDGVHLRNLHPPLRKSSGHFRPAPTAKPGSLFVLPSCTIHFGPLNRPAWKQKEPVPPCGSPAPIFARLHRERIPTGLVLHSSLRREGPEENPLPGKEVFRSPMPSAVFPFHPPCREIPCSGSCHLPDSVVLFLQKNLWN